MRVFRIKPKVINRLMQIDNTNWMSYMGRLGWGQSVKDLWQHENFLMGDADLPVPLFPTLDLNTISYTDTVRASPLGAVLELGGEILPGTIEDAGEPVYVLNILEVYDSIDVEGSRFTAEAGTQTDNVSKAWGIASPAFLPDRIGKRSLFKVSLQSDVVPSAGASDIYTATDRPDIAEDEDFYKVCEECGWLDQFEFEECAVS